MRKALLVLGIVVVAALISGCSGNRPPCPICPPNPEPTPTPPPTHGPGPECAPNNLTNNCWDMRPPATYWEWVCNDYTRVLDPAQCTSTPPPPAHGPGPECAASNMVSQCWDLRPPSTVWEWVCKDFTRVTDPKVCPTAPTPPPPGGGCKFPQGVPLIAGPVNTSLQQVVKQKLSVLTGCSIGSDCPVRQNQQDFQAAVEASLRADGYCAGQHDSTTDEIAITHGGACTDFWQAYKVFACTPALPTDPPNTDTCPIPGRGKVRWGVPGEANYQPTSGCAGTGGGCPLAKDDDHWIEFNFKGTQATNGWQVDATPKYCGQPMPSSAFGFTKCGTKCCELGIDGTGPFGLVCQQQLVDPVDWLGQVRPTPTGNPYTVFLDGQTAKICASWHAPNLGNGCSTYTKPSR